MTLREILEGTDVPQTNFQIKVGGVALNLADLVDYGVNVYSYINKEKKNLFKFRKTADSAAGIKAVITVAANKGGFIVDRTQTKSLLVGKEGLIVYVEIFYKANASSSYISSHKLGAQGGFELAKIIKSSSPSDFS